MCRVDAGCAPRRDSARYRPENDRTSAASTSVVRSRGYRPYSSVVTSGESQTLTLVPSTTPTPTSSAHAPKHHVHAPLGAAPRAMRIPISVRLRVTA